MFSQASRPASAFQAAHHVEQFAEIVLAQLPHAGAAVGQQLDQPFGRQYLQRLAQRRARNAQHLAELALRHAAAVGNVALDDVIAQPGQDLVMQRLVFPAGSRLRSQALVEVVSLGIRGFMAGT